MGQIPHERIVFDPDIMMGKPTIEGPRITLELILEELGEELSVEDVSRAHAHLAKEQVSEALRFAADYMPTRTSPSAVPKQHEGPGPTHEIPGGRMPTSRSWRRGGSQDTRWRPSRQPMRGASDEAVLERALRKGHPADRRRIR